MRSLYWILLITYCQTEAQMPRNASGQFEYTQTIPLDHLSDSSKHVKARRFFSQPFLVHWDSVSDRLDQEAATVSGKGYVEIRIIQGFQKIVIPVQLQMDLSITDNDCRYSIHHLKAVKKGTGIAYPLEEQPPIMKAKVYHKLIDRTQRYISSMIGWLKTYMETKPVKE